jgi:N-acetylglutamate synthase-like GNAT family acetyltransferase
MFAKGIEYQNRNMGIIENRKDQIRIRPYLAGDFHSVLTIMDLNTPKYFAHEEKEAFKYFLQNEIDHYFVVEHHAELIGSGGFNVSKDGKIAYISWDMVHPDFYFMKIGTQLLTHRLQLLLTNNGIDSIIVRTSQHTCQFYEKQGFKILETKENHWAPGFDMVVMKWQGNSY